jgi:Fur family ferric uptake transcriptional regulator
MYAHYVKTRRARVDDWNATLPDGVRLTPQRRAVAELVAAAEGSFTALELYARARGSGLGLATVYRTIELLQRAGSVRALNRDGATTYVRCAPDHHHHLVCISCGGVQETELCAAPPAAVLRRRYGFTPQTHEVEIYGTCADCA